MMQQGYLTMNIPFKTASWIWSNSTPQQDEYGEFVDHFTYKEGTTYEIPSGVNEICAYAFHNNKYITEIEIPDSVTIIVWWRNWLAQKSYTLKVVGSSPAQTT